MFRTQKTHEFKRIIPLDDAHIIIEDEKWLNFACRDFYGLTHHSDVKKNAMKFLLQEGVGLASSSLPGGVLQCQRDLEERLAAMVEKETVLICSSRAQAHLYALNTLASNPSIVYRDITDTFGIETDYTSDILMAGFDAACASSGAFIATSHRIKDSLLSFCEYDREFTLCPAQIGTIQAALELFPYLEGESRQLEQRAFWLKKKAKEMNLSVYPSPPHFLTIEGDRVLIELLTASQITAEVSENKVSFILTVQHSLEHLNELLEVLTLWIKSEASVFADSIQSFTETPER